MKVQFDKIDDLNATLELELERSDYEPEYREELKKYRAQAAMKGFRKGKTPMSFIEKMYGKSILADKINRKLQEKLYNYLKDENIDILGDPLPNENQEQITFDVKELGNYKFKFDLGLSPELEISGVDENSEYVKHLIDVADSMVDEEVQAYQKRFGNSVDTEEIIEENDLIKIEAEEKGSGAVLANGWATTFTVSVSTLTDDIKEQVLKSKKGDSLEFDIFNLEKDKDEEHVRKYLLQLPEEESEREVGNDFVGKISEVKRLEPAEINQELFDKVYGKDVVKSNDEMRNKIKENISGFYAKQSTSLMYRDIMQNLIAKNDMALPETFLKRWLKETNQETTDEKIEEEYGSFEDNLKWTLIKSKLSKKFGVEVQPEELRAHLTEKVMQYFQGYGSNIDQSYISEMVNRMAEDKTQVQNAYNEIEADKLFGEIEKIIAIKENNVSMDEFKSKVEDANKQYNQQN